MLDPELIGYLDQRFGTLADLFARQSERAEHRFERIDQRFEQVDQAVREVHILYEDLDSRLRLVADGVAFFSDALREFRVDVDRQFAEVLSSLRLDGDHSRRQ